MPATEQNIKHEDFVKKNKDIFKSVRIKNEVFERNLKINKYCTCLCQDIKV